MHMNTAGIATCCSCCSLESLLLEGGGAAGSPGVALSESCPVLVCAGACRTASTGGLTFGSCSKDAGGAMTCGAELGTVNSSKTTDAAGPTKAGAANATKAIRTYSSSIMTGHALFSLWITWFVIEKNRSFGHSDFARTS